MTKTEPALLSQSCKSAVAPAAPFTANPTVPAAVPVSTCDAPAIVVRPDIVPFAVMLVTPVKVPEIASVEADVIAPALVMVKMALPAFP